MNELIKYKQIRNVLCEFIFFGTFCLSLVIFKVSWGKSVLLGVSAFPVNN